MLYRGHDVAPTRQRLECVRHVLRSCNLEAVCGYEEREASARERGPFADVVRRGAADECERRRVGKAWVDTATRVLVIDRVVPGVADLLRRVSGSWIPDVQIERSARSREGSGTVG